MFLSNSTLVEFQIACPFSLAYSSEEPHGANNSALIGYEWFLVGGDSAGNRHSDNSDSAALAAFISLEYVCYQTILLLCF
ncbi:hypothetical protein V3C99_002434 [Haemonchus contortus]